MSLKQLTRENHKIAENSRFSKHLVSGQMDGLLYYKYLLNKYYFYLMLENGIRIVRAIPEYAYPIFRAELIYRDLKDLERQYGLSYNPYYIKKTTHDYVEHIERLYKANDTQSLLAHLYVNHFGDLHGGQIIKKLVPGNPQMYEFVNSYQLKLYIRELLTDDMADEANKAFMFSINLFEELEDDIPDMV